MARNQAPSPFVLWLRCLSLGSFSKPPCLLASVKDSRSHCSSCPRAFLVITIGQEELGPDRRRAWHWGLLAVGLETVLVLTGEAWGAEGPWVVQEAALGLTTVGTVSRELTACPASRCWATHAASIILPHVPPCYCEEDPNMMASKRARVRFQVLRGPRA